MSGRWAIILLCLLAIAVVQTGCKGCGTEQKSQLEIDRYTIPKEPVAAPAAVATPATASPTAAAAKPEEPEVFHGPKSESDDGFRITTGFANAAGESTPQPQALEMMQVYLSAMDHDGHPQGQLEDLNGAQVYAFLAARDLRQVYFSLAKQSVRQGADARALKFNPREGGDHALIAAFSIAGATHVVSTPIAIKGALPQVMGPGIEALSNESRQKNKTLRLISLPEAVVKNQPVQLSIHEFDKENVDKGEITMPLLLIVDQEMGEGDVVRWDAAGKAIWLPKKRGTFLVLGVPEVPMGKKEIPEAPVPAWKILVNAKPEP